jgi:hypothetical protein
MVRMILALAVVGAVNGLGGRVAGASLGIYWRLVAGLVMVLFGLLSLDLVPFRLPSLNFLSPSDQRGFNSPHPGYFFFQHTVSKPKSSAPRILDESDRRCASVRGSMRKTPSRIARKDPRKGHRATRHRVERVCVPSASVEGLS